MYTKSFIIRHMFHMSCLFLLSLFHARRVDVTNRCGDTNSCIREHRIKINYCLGICKLSLICSYMRYADFIDGKY